MDKMLKPTLTLDHRPTLEHAAEILRAHGINAFEQDGEIVIYAASTAYWQEVVRFEPTPTTAQHVAETVAHQLADICAGPHSHDLTAPAIVT